MYLTSSSTWVGALTEITPTHTYWLKTTNSAGFSWTYTPITRAIREHEIAPVTFETPVQNTIKVETKKNRTKENLRK